MIAYIEGKIIHKTENQITLLNNGIGYEINIANRIIKKIEEKEEAKLFIHTHVREDTLKLFGFNDQEELKLFKLLLSVSKVGPKLALKSCELPADHIKSFIINKNIEKLTKIDGMGKKTAERVIMELKGKIEISNLNQLDPLITENNHTNIDEKIIQAIQSLGFKRNHITQVLSTMDQKIQNSQEIIKYFLKNN